MELCVYGKWRMMCANSWDNRDASVICREIGYSPFGKSVSSVWLDRKPYNASTLLVYIMQSILITCTLDLVQSSCCMSLHKCVQDDFHGNLGKYIFVHDYNCGAVPYHALANGSMHTKKLSWLLVLY